MIHGERDAYIGPEIAQALFAEGRRAQGTLAGPGGQAQPLPRVRARGLRDPHGRLSSSASPRAGPWKRQPVPTEAPEHVLVFRRAGAGARNVQARLQRHGPGHDLTPSSR